MNRAWEYHAKWSQSDLRRTRTTQLHSYVWYETQSNKWTNKLIDTDNRIAVTKDEGEWGGTEEGKAGQTHGDRKPDLGWWAHNAIHRWCNRIAHLKRICPPDKFNKKEASWHLANMPRELPWMYGSITCVPNSLFLHSLLPVPSRARCFRMASSILMWMMHGPSLLSLLSSYDVIVNNYYKANLFCQVLNTGNGKAQIKSEDPDVNMRFQEM